MSVPQGKNAEQTAPGYNVGWSQPGPIREYANGLAKQSPDVTSLSVLQATIQDLEGVISGFENVSDRMVKLRVRVWGAIPECEPNTKENHPVGQLGMLASRMEALRKIQDKIIDELSQIERIA